MRKIIMSLAVVFAFFMALGFVSTSKTQAIAWDTEDLCEVLYGDGLCPLSEDTAEQPQSISWSTEDLCEVLYGDGLCPLSDEKPTV